MSDPTDIRSRLRDCPDQECLAEQGCGDCLRTCREHDHSEYIAAHPEKVSAKVQS
jgi:hypothetical protein